jgi:hypothetical protein
MNYGTLLWAAFLSLFSTSVIGYVSIVTAIGPWVGPTLALSSIVFFAPFCRSKDEMILAIAAGSMGGIIGTAIGFTFPTLYFLDQAQFNQLVSNQSTFLCLLMALVFVAGYFGHYCAHHVSDEFIEKQELAFPIGQLVYKIVNTQHQKNKTRQLLVGTGVGLGYALLQAKLFFGRALIPAKIVLWNEIKLWQLTVPALNFGMNLMPMFLSIGFIAGHMVTIPLLIGAASKMLIVDPINSLFFATISSMDFTFAFCSGIVLSSAVTGVTRSFKQFCILMPKWFKSKKHEVVGKGISQQITSERIFLTILLMSFLSWCKFSPLAQVYLISATALCAYQISQIAGKIGLALLGRFATFVVIPGMLIFGFNAFQITIVSAFVELCGGVAAETLFGLKAAQMGGVDKNKMYWYQLFGIVCSAIATAFVFYFFVTRFKLGSPQLFAYRAQARALLVQATSFNYYVLGLGIAFGVFLKQMKANPVLVLGGLLMPLSLSLSLITGGALSHFTKNKEEYEPLCSGVYAANALAMFVKTLL